MRPRRCPSRVSKLFSTSSGFARAARPCPCAWHEVKPSLHHLRHLWGRPCAPLAMFSTAHKTYFNAYTYSYIESCRVAEGNMGSTSGQILLQEPTLMSFDSFRLDSLK